MHATTATSVGGLGHQEVARPNHPRANGPDFITYDPRERQLVVWDATADMNRVRKPDQLPARTTIAGCTVNEGTLERLWTALLIRKSGGKLRRHSTKGELADGVLASIGAGTWKLGPFRQAANDRLEAAIELA